MSINGPGAPYVSPSVLLNAPTGISWKTIPNFGSTPQEQLVEATNLAQRASAAIDAYCETCLRATINTETLYGPDDQRFQVLKNGNARLMMSRPPVVSVISGTCQAASDFSGSNAQMIPASAFKVEKPVVGIYGTTSPGPVGENGQAVLLQPGYVSWWYGRSGYEVSVTYMNGYPHTQLTAPVAGGVSAVHVDDVTGMKGAFCTFYSADDGLQESAVVSSVTPDVAGALSGPGTLNLVSPIANSHVAGEIFTTLPATIQQAAIQMATGMAMMRGSTATVVQKIPGSAQNEGATGAGGAAGYTKAAQALVMPYRRTW
jgi:hypothetical protein